MFNKLQAACWWLQVFHDLLIDVISPHKTREMIERPTAQLPRASHCSPIALPVLRLYQNMLSNRRYVSQKTVQSIIATVQMDPHGDWAHEYEGELLGAVMPKEFSNDLLSTMVGLYIGSLVENTVNVTVAFGTPLDQCCINIDCKYQEMTADSFVVISFHQVLIQRRS